MDHEFTEEESMCVPRFVLNPEDAEVNQKTGLPKDLYASYRNEHREHTYTYGNAEHKNPGQYSLRQFCGLEGGQGGFGLIPGQRGGITHGDAMWSAPVYFVERDTSTQAIGSNYTVSFASYSTGVQNVILDNLNKKVSMIPEVYERKIRSFYYPYKSTDRNDYHGFYPEQSGYLGGSWPYLISGDFSPFMTALFNTKKLPAGTNFIPTYAGQDGMPFVGHRGTPVGYGPYGKGPFNCIIVDYSLEKKTLDPEKFPRHKVLKDSPAGSGQVWEYEKLPTYWPNLDGYFDTKEDIMMVKHLGTDTAAPVFYF